MSSSKAKGKMRAESPASSSPPANDGADEPRDITPPPNQTLSAKAKGKMPARSPVSSSPAASDGDGEQQDTTSSPPPGVMEAVVDEMENFINDKNTTTEGIEMMLNIIQQAKALKEAEGRRVKTAPIESLLPIDEIKERLRIGCKLEPARLWRHFDIKVLMTIPLNKLALMERKHDKAEGDPQVQIPFDEWECFVRLFLKALKADLDDLETMEEPRQQPSPKRQKVTPENDGNQPQNDKIDQDPAELLACNLRDSYQCVLLHTDNPDICHIVPFGINSNETNLAYLMSIEGGLSWCWEDGDFNGAELLTSGLGCSDKLWNMVALSRRMHRRWRQAHWTFKCLGVDWDEEEEGFFIKLQVHWMKNDEDDDEWLDDEDDFSDGWRFPVNMNAVDGVARMVEGWKEKPDHDDWSCPTIDFKSPYPVESGQVLKIFMPVDDCMKMKAMVDLQWAAMQIASMSQLLGNDDFLNWEPHGLMECEMDSSSKGKGKERASEPESETIMEGEVFPFTL